MLFKRLEHLTFHLDDVEIHPSLSVKKLSAVFYTHMKMDNHVTQLSRSLNFHIRNLSRIRRFIDVNSCHNAIRSLILSRLDYCNALLNGIFFKYGEMQYIDGCIHKLTSYLMRILRSTT